MKKNIGILLVTVILFLTQSSFGQLKSDIEKQNKKGNAVFLVVTDGGTDLASAKEIALKAKKSCSKSEVLTMDKADKANAELVKKYGLAGSQTPLILVIASNGVVSGGYLKSQATAENLVDAIPTKKQAEALLGFSENKPVMVVISKKTMTDKTIAIEECKKAAKELNGNAVVVDVSLDDKSEAAFIKLLNPDLTASKTNVMVFNNKGQFSSKFESPVKSMDLVSAAKKAPSGGCCPGGSSKGCAPTKGCGK
jgi:hypothetical protein